MPETNSRNRLVVFRLTQQEYDNLKEACSDKGSRSLSEFTRSELLAGSKPDVLEGVLDKRLIAVEQRLTDLQESVAQIADRLEHPNRPPEES